MDSSVRSSRGKPSLVDGQRGYGLVEVLVGVALLAVAMVVLLGTFSTLLVGARVAERQTVEQRLARNEIEHQLAQPFPKDCRTSPSSASVPVGSTTYAIEVLCSNPYSRPDLIELTVTVSDPSGAAFSLSADRAAVRLPGRAD